MRTWPRAAAALLLAAAAAPPAHADTALYDALGAQAGITRLMEALVPRLKADAQIGHFFQETATRHLVKQLSDQVCQLSGGPCKLDAPDMKEAHASMQITPADFNRLVELLQRSMEAQGLPFRVQNRLLALLAPMHRDIVTAPARVDRTPGPGISPARPARRRRHHPALTFQPSQETTSMKTLHRLLPVIAALAALPALAQDKPVEIKLAHWVPANHLLAQTGFIPWGKSIEAASGGSIKVSIFPAQQLGKAPDHYDMARDGIATVAYVNPGYQPGRFPIIAAGELPFLVDKPGPASQALDAWYRQYAEREMKDVKVCFTHLHVGTFHSKTAITDPAQIKGMKIRPANGTVGQMVNTLGGTAVQVSAPEARDALSKGVADAITFPWNSIISFGIDKVTTFHTDMRLYAAVFVWAMNKPFYEGLSANQKKVIDDHCNNEWAAKVGMAWGDAEDAGREKLIAMGGHTIVPMSPAQIGVWKNAVAPVYDQWVANADKAGIPGKKALDDLKAELKKTGGAY